MPALNILGSLFGSDWARMADEAYQRGELERAAKLYRKAGRAEQAGKLLTRLGRVDDAVEAFRDGDLHLQAAQLLADEGRHKEAMIGFEEAGAHRLAAQCALRLRQRMRAARLFENASMDEQAMEQYLHEEAFEEALECLERVLGGIDLEGTSTDIVAVDRKRNRLLQQKADLLSRVDRTEEAAELMLQVGQSERAAALLQKVGRIGEAAHALHGIGHHGRALELLDRNPLADPELRARLLGLCSRPAEAAPVWEALGQHEEAATSWEEARKWDRAAIHWDRLGQTAHAAELYLKAHQPEKAAEAYSRAGLFRHAAEAFAQAESPLQAGDAWSAAEEHLRAGKCYLEADAPDSARDSFQAVQPNNRDYAEATTLLLPLLFDDGLIEGVRHRIELAERSGAWARLSTTERQYWTARLEEAEGDVSEARLAYERVLAEKSGFRDATERLSRLREDLEKTMQASQGPARVSDTVPVVQAGAAAKPPVTDANVDTGTIVAFVDLGALPWTLGEAESPWWPGTQLRAASHRRSGEEATLALVDLPAADPRRPQMRRAIRKIVGLRHSAILELRDVIFTDEHGVLVYEPFDGTTLERRLTASRLEPLGAVAILSRIAEALGQLHKLGQAHGWISPRTILIQEADRAVLAGLGLAGVVSVQDPVRLAYQAPEAELDPDDADSPAADLYSLGLLGIELLRAMLPVGSQGPRIDPRQVEWPDEVVEIVPDNVRNELLRCLAKDPLERPSVAELRAALGSIGLVPGQLLAGRYEILGELGQGGMSRVYRARDRDLSEEVAIKTVLTPALGRSEDEDRLLREVQICRRISHPNVVRVHDFGRFSQGIFVIMEILDGPGLDQLILMEAPMSLDRVRKVLLEVASALAEAHRLKIVHRDLKPGNVILADGRFKVLDFGIARLTDGSGSQLTRTGEVIGSPLFMAPEQIQGLELTGACDLYALGVIVYTLLTGREPFQGETPTAVVLKHLHEAPPDPTKLRPDLPAPWIRLVADLLAKKPEDRIESADALITRVHSLPVDDAPEPLL